MNSYVQLLVLCISFVYGVLLYYLNRFNCRLIKSKNIISKVLISSLYLFNISLLYVCCLYYLNGGVLHIYFVLFIVMGYILISVNKRK